MDPGIGPLFNSPFVQKGVGVCVYQMNTYLSHAYIKTRCSNLPFRGRAARGSRVCLPREEGARSRHKCLFEENVRKTRKRCGLWTLSVKGSGVVFTQGEGISTPRVRHKGRQPLIKCANMTSKCFIFPFYVFLSFYAFYLFVVDKGVSLAPTYP